MKAKSTVLLIQSQRERERKRAKWQQSLKKSTHPFISITYWILTQKLIIISIFIIHLSRSTAARAITTRAKRAKEMLHKMKKSRKKNLRCWKLVSISSNLYTIFIRVVYFQAKACHADNENEEKKMLGKKELTQKKST